MSGNTADQDNSIEEILASIRQIISEDQPKVDAPEALPPVSASPSEPVFVPLPSAPVEEPASATDVFELVDRVVAEDEVLLPVDLQPDVDKSLQVEMRDPPVDDVFAPIPTNVEEDSVFTDEAASVTLGAFAKLSDTIALERQKSVGTGVTLEDIVKDMLAPLLREWIDQRVPIIVERLVREELEKLARQAREG